MMPTIRRDQAAALSAAHASIPVSGSSARTSHAQPTNELSRFGRTRHVGQAPVVAIFVGLRDAALARRQAAERGSVSVLAALCMTVLFGMLAVGIDLGYAYGQRRLAQNVADSAALNATVVVGKRLRAISETAVKDLDVVGAIGGIASRSSGGFNFGPGLTGEYVRRDSSGSLQKVGDVGTGVPCLSDGTSGCIPSNATGVRVLSRTTFGTFFAPIFNVTALSTGARAAALTMAVTGVSLDGPGVAPYAIWTGEDGADGDGDGTRREMRDGSTPPDFLCRDGNGQPIVLSVDGATYVAPEGSRRSAGGMAYSYACSGGGAGPISRGTMFTIRSTPNFERPNVSAENPNWQVTASNFKGFIRVDTSDGLVGIGSYVSDGGIAQGTEEAALDVIDQCYRTYCTLIMPIVSYASSPSSSGHPHLLVTGFAAVKLRDRSVVVNTENPVNAPTSYDWKAMVVDAPVTCCAATFTETIAPGAGQLLVARLVQ